MDKLTEIKDLIEKSILASKCIIITYTNSSKKTDRYLLDNLSSVWADKINTIAHSITKNKKPSFKAFRLDRIHEIEITDIDYLPREVLIEKVKDGTIFDEEDNRMRRKGGIVYPSSINYLKSYRTENKDEITKKFNEIDIPEKEGWKRAIMYKIIDGDTYDVIIEDEKSKIVNTRLYGVDAPEYKEEITEDNNIENNLGLESKIFVEDMFKKNRFCYVRSIKNQEQDSYKRYLYEILNFDGSSIGYELLANGLGLPMLGYFSDSKVRQKYIDLTNKAYNDELGLWRIKEIYDRYNNIMSNVCVTEFNILGYIPNKVSAFNKYLKRNPKLKIIQKALYRKRERVRNVENANKDFDNMTKDLDLSYYNIEAYRELCKRYLGVVKKISADENNINKLFDYLEEIAEIIDKLKLGEGEVRGNFSTSSLSTRLIYHIKGGVLYDKTIPEICFKTEDDAKYCGFKKSKV